jgi:FKBP-type peptidyl-prolyl cis-trans isomerase
LPQSRQRKTGKARKRNKGLYAATKAKPPVGRNRQARIVASVVVLVLAAGVIVYMFKNRAEKPLHEVTTPSGLKYTKLVEGTGATPRRGQTVTVHYTGTLENGVEFDSSRNRGKPADFRIGVGSVIQGWDEALMMMKVGDRWKLVVPSNLGYLQHGRPPDIPGNATLIFDVELLGVK